MTSLTARGAGVTFNGNPNFWIDGNADMNCDELLDADFVSFQNGQARGTCNVDTWEEP